MTEPTFITFGCRLNTYETEVMRNHAEKAGANDSRRSENGHDNRRRNTRFTDIWTEKQRR